MDEGILGNLVEVEEEDILCFVLIGPSGEYAGEVLDTYVGALVVGFLVVDYVSRSVLPQEPLSVVGNLSIVKFFEIQFLFIVGGHVLVAYLEGVVAACVAYCECICAVSGDSQIRIGTGELRGNRVVCVVSFLEQSENCISSFVVDYVLLAWSKYSVPCSVIERRCGIFRIDQVELKRHVVFVDGCGEASSEELYAVVGVRIDVCGLVIVRYRRALEVEAVGGSRRRERPGVVRICDAVDGHFCVSIFTYCAGPYCDAAVFVAVSIECVCAVIVLLYCPNVVFGELCYLAILHDYRIGLEVPVSVRLIADGGHVFLVVDGNCCAVSQLIEACDQVSLLRLCALLV